MISCFRKLWAGVCCQCWATIGGGLIFFIFAVIAVECAVREGWYAEIPKRFLLIRPSDHHTDVNIKLAQEERGKRSHYPRIALVGGSDMRECVRGERSLQRLVSDRLARPVIVSNLSFPRQTFSQAITIVDKMPAVMSVLGVSMQRFTHSKADYRDNVKRPRFWFQTRAEKRFLATQGVFPRNVLTYALGITEYLNQYLWTQRHKLIRGNLPQTYFSEHYFVRSGSTERKRTLFESYRKRHVSRFWRNVDLNMAALEALLKVIQTRQQSVLLVELPINPKLVSVVELARYHYRQQVASLARRYGAVYLDFSDSLAFEDKDFRDQSHLVGRARRIFESALAKQIETYWPENVRIS